MAITMVGGFESAAHEFFAVRQIATISAERMNESRSIWAPQWKNVSVGSALSLRIFLRGGGTPARAPCAARAGVPAHATQTKRFSSSLRTTSVFSAAGVLTGGSVELRMNP